MMSVIWMLKLPSSFRTSRALKKLSRPGDATGLTVLLPTLQGLLCSLPTVILLLVQTRWIRVLGGSLSCINSYFIFCRQGVNTFADYLLAYLWTMLRRRTDGSLNGWF